ncbi:MAG: BamA/OMP85 family outer membrane protein, partial [Terriglobales bacterium]
QQDPAADLRRVIYQVNRGDSHKLVNIAIVTGTPYFSQDAIRERLLIREAGWLLPHGRFSQSLLNADLESIRLLYLTNGFPQVRVTADVQDDCQGKKGQLCVTLKIEEGPQMLVASLKIAGNESIPASDLLDVISNLQGQPYSEDKLVSDREAVLSYYFNRGFPQASFEPTVEPEAGNSTRVNLVYNVHEGPQFLVDRIVVSGLRTTRPWVIERESLVHEGAPISAGDMLETQRQLYDLGIFNEVNLAVANPQGSATRKNVVLQVEEAKRYTFDYGFGLEVQTGSDPGGSQPQARTGVSPRFSFDVTRINFRGRNHTIVFKSRIGRLQQRGLISYIVPRWFNRKNLKFSVTTLFDTTRDVRTFTSERLEGSVQAEHTWSKATTFLYRFAYRRVKVDPTTLAVDPNLIPLLSRPVRVGLPSFSYIRDTRDNPIESSKGSYNTLDAGISSSIFGSEASFWRLFIQNSTYHLFGRKRFGRYFVFARSTRIGFEEPLDSDSPTEIPLPERYFSGGGNSHRGFAINQAGPRDRQTGFPLGGDAMFLNNLELRFPPMALPWVGENVSAVIFHDAGNVFSTAGDLFGNLFRFSQKSKRQCQLLTLMANCDLDYTSHAIGGGLRYKTPIGPVRFDVGYNLNPPTFPVRAEGRSETLRRLNFFFSIGQTF